jgi:DNA-binding NarL/FixJ family response regulator
LAYHAATAGQARTAAQLLGASDEIRTGAGATVMAVLAPYVAMAEDTATKALGASKYRTEFDAGRHLTREAAVRLALNEKPAPVSPGIHHDGLGKREADVADLVAAGLSNKQIAARLFISERTVDSHVRSILNKLGFNSRAQIAGWVASSDRP